MVSQMIKLLTYLEIPIIQIKIAVIVILWLLRAFHLRHQALIQHAFDL